MVVDDPQVFPGFLTPVLTQLSFQSHQQLFSHALVEVRGKNMPGSKFASTGYQTHNHQVRHAHHWATQESKKKSKHQK